MLRYASVALLIVGSAGPAMAQGADPRQVDFILRPGQDPGSADPDTFWITQLAPDAAAVDGPVGPPLAGPTGAEPIGPPLAGPADTRALEPARAVARQLDRGADPDDPFAATGIAIGSFILRPAIEVGVSATDNIAESSDGESAIGFVIAPEITLLAEDDRYRVEAEIEGEAVIYGDREFDERDADARIRGRYELTSRTTLEAAAGYSYDLDRFSDPDTPDAAAERPAVQEFDAELGATQRFGRLAVGLNGAVQRTLHDDVALAGGGTASREELDTTEYALRQRTSYEASAAATPYAEIAAGRRQYDIAEDSDGFERSSFWGELRGGLIFDFGEKLRGEAALGYRREDLDDDRLDDLNVLIADASVIWSPQRLTELRFELETGVGSTGIPDASGTVTYTGRFVAQRRVGARVTLEGGAELEWERFVGGDRRDVTFSAFASASYAINRWASVVGRYGYERTDSTDPEGDYDENIVSVRLRLQR